MLVLPLLLSLGGQAVEILLQPRRHLPEHSSVPFRIVEVEIDTAKIVLLGVAVSLEDRFIEPGGVSLGPGFRVYGKPLVRHEHVVIDLLHRLLGDDLVAPGTRGHGQGQGQGCKKGTEKSLLHGSYLRVAPNSLRKEESILSIILSTSASVKVFSRSCRTKPRAYCFLPSGIFSPR